MSDKRWTNLNESRKLLTHRQPGLESSHDFNTVQTETNRRRDAEDQTIAKGPVIAAVPAPPSTTPVIPAALIDRFHKWGSTYVTVANLHLSGDDSVPDPGAYHTIADGYAFAKTLKARFTTDYERVVVWVSGGQYAEDLVFDEPGIDVVGIGRPEIHGHIYKDPANNDFLFDNFKIINPDTEEDDEPRDFCGLYLDANLTNSGQHFSDVQIRNCWFEGPNMQVHDRCWADFYNCDFVSTDNLSTGIPSVQCVWMRKQLTFGTPPTYTAEQKKWTQFRNCRFNGCPDPAGYLSPTYFKKGYALEITCINIDTLAWASNVLTQESGVYLKDCIISGFTTNYGWKLRHDHCAHIEGYIVVETAGSVHHLAFCSGEDGVDASTFFNHSVFTVRYLTCGIDATSVTPTGTCNIYLRHIVHAGADHAFPAIVMPAGAECIDGANLVPPQVAANGTVYAANYSTPTLFVYAPGGVEAAVISNVTVSANNLIFTDNWEDV